MVLLLPKVEAMALLMAGVRPIAFNKGPRAGDSTAASCWSNGSLAMTRSRAAAQGMKQSAAGPSLMSLARRQCREAVQAMGKEMHEPFATRSSHRMHI